jgi:EmrB/QacA subfamily drug resistance transporter
VLVAILLGTFVGTLGNSTVNVALPSMMAEFDVPVTSAVWVVTLYTLVFAVLMPVAGYLADLYGHRRLYLLGMGLYTAGLLASGLAPSFAWLLGSRVLMGAGVAPTLPVIMALISLIFAPEQRGRAVGLWALANGAGHTLGPVMSGFLVERLGWRAIFLLPVPLCLINLGLVRWLAPSGAAGSKRWFDFGGAAALTVAALGLMLALTGSAQWGWGASRSIALWGATLGASVVFLVVERSVPSPFVDLRLFANPSYAAATGVIALQLFCLFGLLLALPVFLTQAQGWESHTAGLLILPLPLAMAVVGPMAGRLADARGSRWACTVGMALVIISALALLGLRPASGLPIPWAALVGVLLIMGAGMGLVQSPTAAAVTYVVPPHRLGVATGIFHMVRFVSGTLGSTVFSLVLSGNGVGTGLGFQHVVVVALIAAGLALVIARGLPGRAAVPQRLNGP